MIKNKNIINELITNKTISNIIKSYNNYLIDYKQPINNNETETDIINDTIILLDTINFSNDYSSNYNSRSSFSSGENINFDFNQEKIIPSNSKSSSSDSKKKDKNKYKELAVNIKKKNTSDKTKKIISIYNFNFNSNKIYKEDLITNNIV